MSGKSQQDYYSPPVFNGPDDGIVRSATNIRRSHFTLKIGSYTMVCEELEKYESDIFEVGGYKWSLSFYPKGNSKSGGEGHISLFLKVAETSTLPCGWEVLAEFKFFVFDQLRDSYLTIQEGGVRRFQEIKTEWGIARMECFNLIKNPSNNIYTWEIKNFSTSNDNFYFSEGFTIEGTTWNLKVCPKGDSTGKEKAYLSVYLCHESNNQERVYAEYKLRVKNQLDSKKSEEIKDKEWFGPSAKGCGYCTFISLEDLRDKSKGYLVDDKLIVEAEIVMTSVTKTLS
ncbi:TRAF-like family protein [Corchorus olitorius]|uniref:TRAF-like family protein n=1 Tax=Corchorus olitorius TaxID=93759 RepID=A0A1R3KNW7_9ROSI|nr:TRAF-like family protein [Corchorus olitorius]